MFVVLLPNVFHTNDMFALSEKSAEKKTKTGRLPIAHYKQKPAGSDLWPVNRCIPTLFHTMKVETISCQTPKKEQSAGKVFRMIWLPYSKLFMAIWFFVRDTDWNVRFSLTIFPWKTTTAMVTIHFHYMKQNSLDSLLEVFCVPWKKVFQILKDMM